MKSDNKGNRMTTLQFEMAPVKLIKSYLRGLINPNGYWKPGTAVGIKTTPVPELAAHDWVIIKTRYCGICGSDMMEVTLSGAIDNPLQSLISFPHIMGHEIVGVVEEAGKDVTSIKKGDRVCVTPWLPCKPRGIEPECPRCREGDYKHCRNFRRGIMPPGMHLGVATGYGGFAPYVAVHESQCFTIPDRVDFEEAVLADPFSVAFHSCLLLDPKPESLILVYGLGILGLMSVVCLKRIFNVEQVVAVGRYPFQREGAIKLGAEHVFNTSGPALVEEVAAYTNAELYTPQKGSKWTMDGVDGIIDTVASAETLEAGLRFLATQGKLVFTGVSTPKRYENTPHYFKELEVIGSNSFAVESFQGKKAHAFDFFMDFLTEGKIDLKAMVTHKYPLLEYDKAFNTLANKSKTCAVKVVFDFGEANGGQCF